MAQPFWFKTHAPGRYTVRLREGDVYLGEIEKRGERAWVLEDGRSFPSRRGAAEALRLKLEADPGLPIIQITPAATMVGLEDEPAQIEDEPADEPAQIEDEPADEPAQAEDEPIEAIWAELEQRFQSETPIEGTIIARIRGGYSVDIGVRGFLPASQLQVRASRPSDKPIGQRLEFRIIKLNAARKNVVLSRRVLLESAQQESRAQLLTRFQEGDIVEGTVNKIMRYGAFIDLGGIDGLLHITDMREGWVSHPAKVVEVGQRLKVKILKIDAEAERISLGLKQLQQIEEDLALAGQPGNEESTPHDHANEAPLAAAVALEAGDARDADAGESAASGSDQAVVLATLTEPVAEPVEAVAEPVEAVIEPVEAVAEPVEAVAEPVEAVIEPVEAVAEPVEAVIEPVEAVAEPVEAVAEPVEAV
ncbi:S1 RNA-binding domain-containing protein, partial [Myxococcota bacterium]|nr:S1 RNA-binding domain-containing protein [Myxococcota bacterium]